MFVLKRNFPLTSSIYESFQHSQKTVDAIISDMIIRVREDHKHVVTSLLDLNKIYNLKFEGLQRSMVNAFVGGMLLRFVQGRQEIDSKNHILSQAMSFLNIRFTREVDNIIDDTMSDPQEKRKFIQSCLGIIEGTSTLDQVNTSDPKKLVVYYLANDIHRIIQDFENKELFLDIYRTLGGYIFAEFDHERIPSVENEYLRDMVDSINYTIDETKLSQQEKISVKISTGGAMMCTLLLVLPDIIDTVDEDQKKSLQNILSIGAAMQMKDDIQDREKDISNGEKSFATLADKNDMGKFEKLQRQLYHLGWEGLSGYQKSLMKPLDTLFKVYTKKYSVK